GAAETRPGRDSPFTPPVGPPRTAGVYRPVPRSQPASGGFGGLGRGVRRRSAVAREPLLVVAQRLQRRAEQRPQAHPELGLVLPQAVRLLADALALRVGAVQDLAGPGLGLAHGELGLSRGLRAPLVGRLLGGHERLA